MFSLLYFYLNYQKIKFEKAKHQELENRDECRILNPRNNNCYYLLRNFYASDSMFHALHSLFYLIF